MKRFCAMLAVLLMVVCSAQAEIVGRAGDQYIHSWTAPNGQTLYFVSQEQEPYVHMEDVNFDGTEDVVVLTTEGASNFGYEFFVWSNGVYVPVAHGSADELVNYTLYPELGLVETFLDEGPAGILHVRKLWRWDGTDLLLMRTASSEEAETWTFDNGVTTVVTNSRLAHMRVWRTIDGVTDTTPLMDVTVAMDDEEAIQAAQQEEAKAFWLGLRP